MRSGTHDTHRAEEETRNQVSGQGTSSAVPKGYAVGSMFSRSGKRGNVLVEMLHRNSVYESDPGQWSDDFRTRRS